MRKGASCRAKSVSSRRKMTGKAIVLSLAAFVLVGVLGLISWAAAPDPSPSRIQAEFGKAIAISAPIRHAVATNLTALVAAVRKRTLSDDSYPNAGSSDLAAPWAGKPMPGSSVHPNQDEPLGSRLPANRPPSADSAVRPAAPLGSLRYVATTGSDGGNNCLNPALPCGLLLCSSIVYSNFSS